MNLYISKISAALALICLIAFSSFAQMDEEALELSVAQNLARPAVPKKAETYVRTSMDQLRRRLVKNGFNVASMRDGEVLRITIPCDELFPIGSVDLKSSALLSLSQLGSLVGEPKKYKLLITVHTDDTGDDQYADSISAARANAVDDALWQIAGEKETNVIPYGLGKDEPLVDNSSRANRARNRRVDIFIVPEVALIEQSGIKIKNNK